MGQSPFMPQGPPERVPRKPAKPRAFGILQAATAAAVAQAVSQGLLSPFDSHVLWFVIGHYDHKKLNTGLRACTVADAMGKSRGQVSRAVRRLADLCFIALDARGCIHISPELMASSNEKRRAVEHAVFAAMIAARAAKKRLPRQPRALPASISPFL